MKLLNVVVWFEFIYLFIHLFLLSLSELIVKCVIGFGRFVKNLED
jgi:hypothetical protein